MTLTIDRHDGGPQYLITPEEAEGIADRLRRIAQAARKLRSGEPGAN